MAQSVNRISNALIDPAVERGFTLPSNYYIEPSWLELEQQRLFFKTWQVIGYHEQVTKPGDYFTFDLLGEPLLVARGTDNALRGFYNVCRHRAGPPAEGCGSRKVFRCGYHGWTYNLEGQLLNAPEMEGVCDFDPRQFALRPIPVDEWGGLVFVNLDPQAEPLLRDLRELPEQAAKFGFDKMRFYKRHDYIMECNWKVYIDNYLEGYHLPSVHPSLNRELDYSQYVTTLYARHLLQYSPIRGPENESTSERRYRQSEAELAAEYYWIFPNWMLNCYPDNMSLNIVLPLGVERTVAIFIWFFPEPTLNTDTPETTFRFSDEIQIEDGQICEVVQRNLRSQSYDRGRYSAKQEKGVHQFHRLYAEAMGLEGRR
ncbi:MAG TPA: aromatic ring-hydroxylating dioxygenase subunit alpha [Terriglobales bacterium]|nr:aromatic ring-hydroxylating dioxygenase subunit alpha [Terriglobales bacterium]